MANEVDVALANSSNFDAIKGCPRLGGDDDSEVHANWPPEPSLQIGAICELIIFIMLLYGMLETKTLYFRYSVRREAYFEQMLTLVNVIYDP